MIATGAASRRERKSARAISQRAGACRATTRRWPPRSANMIVEMEERLRLGRFGAVEDGSPRGAEAVGQVGHGHVRGAEPEGARARREDLGEMGLAAAGGSDQHQGRPRPCGPAVEPGDSSGIGRRDQEIGAAERRAVAEIERQLAHARHAPRSASSKPRHQRTTYPGPTAPW